MKNKRSDAFNQGFLAGYEYMNGNNPYYKSQSPEEWEDWHEGWSEGQATYNEEHRHNG